MTPGPTIIKKCAKCAGLIAEHTIGSGNNFGAVFWTDGKMEAPMLPDHPWLVKCPHCSALLWIDEQAEIGEVEPYAGPMPKEFKGAKRYKTPTLRDYLTFLLEPPRNRRKMRYVRLRAWWAGNDSRREACTPSPLSKRERQNLNEFHPLLGRNPEDRLMKAEIFRELGEFDKALKLLSRPLDERLSRAAGFIRGLAMEKKTTVATLLLG